jgi:hypothetical protein
LPSKIGLYIAMKKIKLCRMIKQEPGKYKLLKWIGGILGVLILITAGAAIYISATWKPFITEKIKSGVYESSDHLYRINFNELRLNVLTGTATLDSVELLPDTAVYNQLRKQRIAPVHTYHIKLARLRLTRIGILTAYFKKRVNMNAIILDRPTIDMIHHRVTQNRDTVKTEKGLYDQISKSLEAVHVRTLRVLNADFNYVDGETAKTLNSVNKLNVNVTDILIDSLSKSDTSRFYYSKDVAFELAGYKSVTKDRMYTIKVDSVSGFARKGSVRVKGVQVIPMYPDLTFSRKYSTQRDRYDLNFNTIQIEGLDFTRINAEGLVYARSLTIGPAQVKIFMNRELKPSTANKSQNFPHLALQRLSLPLIVDAVRLKNVDVAYTEYNAIPQKRGTIHIDNLRGQLRNVTNDTLQIRKHPAMVAELQTRLVKAADLDIKINFDLSAKDGAFKYTGNVGSFDMRSLNTVAEVLGMVQVKSGRVQKLDFDLSGNTTGARGTMRMYYTGLEVNLLKEGEEGEPMKRKGLLSFLANELVIKDANPYKGEALRVAKIEYVRPPSSSFFSLLWKGVFTGLRETVGIGGFKTKSPQESHKKVVEKKQERAEKRKERQEERQEKRETRKARSAN